VVDVATVEGVESALVEVVPESSDALHAEKPTSNTRVAIPTLTGDPTDLIT
jgi:hypothetical protein